MTGTQIKCKFQHLWKSFLSRMSCFFMFVQSWFKKEISNGVAFASGLLICMGIATIIFVRITWPDNQNEYLENVFVEAHGLLFDLIVFGVILELYNRRQRKIVEIHRNEEIINDYKKWNSTEGNLRIAGSIRRLAILGKADIDLGGIALTNFSFTEEEIISLQGSRFYGDWDFEKGNKRQSTILTDVSFANTDCRKVQFGKDLSSHVLFTNVSFFYTDLRESVFSKVTIKSKKQEQTEKDMERYIANHGERDNCKLDLPGFFRADIEGAKFFETVFENIDFRYVLNIEKASFENCGGLETCLFDDGFDYHSLGTNNLKRWWV